MVGSDESDKDKFEPQHRRMSARIQKQTADRRSHEQQELFRGREEIGRRLSEHYKQEKERIANYLFGPHNETTSIPSRFPEDQASSSSRRWSQEGPSHTGGREIDLEGNISLENDAHSSAGRWTHYYPPPCGRWTHNYPPRTPGWMNLEEGITAQDDPPPSPGPLQHQLREDERRLDQLFREKSPPLQLEQLDQQRARAVQHKRKFPAEDEQQPGQRPESSRHGSGEMNRAAIVQVDEIGVIPKRCQTAESLENIPPGVARLRAAILYQFRLTRSSFGTRDYRYPVNEVFMEWGRKWIIKTSTIKYGEDIKLPNNGSQDFQIKYIPLFPYVGATFTLRQFDQIAPWYPNMRRYALQLIKGSYEDTSQLLIVGDAREDHSLAAFINSNLGIEHKTGPASCEWQNTDNNDSSCHFFNAECQKYLDIIQQQNQIRYYAMTVASRNIAKGEELFVDYEFMNT